jgi:hypothetical protein
MKHKMAVCLWRLLSAVLVICGLFAHISDAQATTPVPAPGWLITSQALPTDFSSSYPKNFYELVVTNVGGAPSSGPVTVTDTLPPGLTPQAVEYRNQEEGKGKSVSCTSLPTLSCTIASPIEPLQSVVIDIYVQPSGTSEVSVTNSASVSGGDAVGPAETLASPNFINSTLPPRFEVRDFTFDVTSTAGSADAQAGDHPYAVTASLGYPVTSTAGGLTEVPYEPKHIVVELPLGLVGDPAALPQCTLTRLKVEGLCPADAAIGYLEWSTNANGSLTSPVEPGGSLIYNVTPENGYPAQFAAEVVGLPVSFYGVVVHTPTGYALRVIAPSVIREGFSLNHISFFGNPSAVNGGGGPAAPFFTYPEDCSTGAPEVVLHADSWQDPAEVPVNEQTGAPELNAVNFEEAQWVTTKAILPAPTGCELLAPLFKPSLAVAPSSGSEGGSALVDSPSAYSVNFEVPQSNDATAEEPDFDSSFDETPGTPPVKDVRVTLPAGVSVSPSVANRSLEGCTEAQEALDSNEPSQCPLSSKIGTVEVKTPLLAMRDLEEGTEYGKVTGAETIEGSVYLVAPHPGDLSLEGKGAGRFRLMIELHSERYGIDIKLPGEAEANTETGQLTATFKENPQLPVSDLKLHFNGGPRAPLANPQECGSYTTTAVVTSWAEPADGAGVGSSNGFVVDGCGSSLPFAPAFDAGTASPAAGSYSSFTLSFARNDGEQDLGAITVNTPPGLLGKIAGIPKCGQAEIESTEKDGRSACPASSEIGVALAAVGAGEHPFQISDGKVFLTGPYGDGPFGLAVVVPAVAGPFDLGDVVVRAAIHVNPKTAALTIASDPLPQIRDGVPFRLRFTEVVIDRPDFMLNATNCTQQQISATIMGEHPLGSSEADKLSPVSSPYAANGCAKLAFAPQLTASTNAKTSRRDGASLTVKLVYPQEGEANVSRVRVQLPKRLPARQATLKNACPEGTFAANPASCPALSVIGSAKAVTPLLSVPLTGPAYFVSHGGAKFPEIVSVLQGEGVTIDLAGETFIGKDGVTTSTFASVPDAPVSSFEIELPQGPDSVLGAPGGHLCKGRLSMPTVIEGQNGAQRTQQTHITVSACAAKGGSKLKKKKRRSAKKALHRGVKGITKRHRRSGRRDLAG